MAMYIPAKDDWAKVFQQIGLGASEGFQQSADQRALQNAVSSLPPNATPRQIIDTLTSAKTYSPEAKQTAIKNYMGAEQFDIAREKNRIALLRQKTDQDTSKLKSSLITDGMPDYEAELYVHSPKGVQDRMMAAHNEAKARGLRTPIGLSVQNQTAPQVATQTPSEIEQDTEQVDQDKAELSQEEQALGEEITAATPVPVEAIESPTVQPAKQKTREDLAKLAAPKPKEWQDVPPPKETTAAEREKWRTKNQSENNKLLLATKAKTNSHTNALIRFNRLDTLNNSGKLPSGIGRLTIDPETGEPRPIASLLGIVNPETQDFVKTMNDFLIDAKSYFGARVTNFDIGAFKSRLPTLMNTEDGRRLIIQQMKLMEELQLVHDKTLEQGLKHYGRDASYTDIQRIVDEKTETQEAEIIGKINNLDQASRMQTVMAKNPKYENTQLMQTPQGNFKAVPKDKVLSAKGKGWIAW